MIKNTLACLLMASTLTACAHPGQNSYNEADVGQNAVIEFGKIINERHVDIIGRNTGTGSAVGMGAGLVGGSYIGSGGGSVGAALAGLIIGGIAGAVAEQAMNDRQGIEYIITFRDHTTRSIVQNIAKDDQPLHVGQRVMVQTAGTYQRVLPAHPAH